MSQKHPRTGQSSKPIRFACGGLLLLIAVLAGCSPRPYIWLPPVTTAEQAAPLEGKFVWYELVTENADAAAQFYQRLFAWQIDPAQAIAGYRPIFNRGRMIGGIIQSEGHMPEAPEALWIGSLSVGDLDAALARVRQGGGKILDGPDRIPARGRLALVQDNSGALLIVMQSDQGDPPDIEMRPGDWFWNDLFTHDTAAATNFYTALVGYQAKRVEVEGTQSYQILLRDNRPRAGIVDLPWPEVSANWVPYVLVDDIAPTIQDALRLGGSLLLHLDNVALLTDPTGAAFGIHSRRPNSGGDT